jgi:aminobenzoyl-glutamate utilization protein B
MTLLSDTAYHSFIGEVEALNTTTIRRLTRSRRHQLLAIAQDEFDERTGGGVGGTKWVPPLLPKDFHPPVDLRWPEYIQTARGEEWWIPTPAVGSGAGELL